MVLLHLLLVLLQNFKLVLISICRATFVSSERFACNFFFFFFAKSRNYLNRDIVSFILIKRVETTGHILRFHRRNLRHALCKIEDGGARLSPVTLGDERFAQS